MLVWVKDGEELLISTSVQEMIVPVDGAKRLTPMLVSVMWSVRIMMLALLPTYGTSYQRVCGRARGYQKRQADRFWSYHYHGQTTTIDGYYAVGLLLSYGNPRQHIWSYVIGKYHTDPGHVLLVEEQTLPLCGY